MNQGVANGASVFVSPGAALLAERRRQGLSLGDISRQLKLSVRQVEALERDDFSGFKGSVFIHGFIRNYAKLLSLDPDPLIRAADSMLAPPAAVSPTPIEQASRPGNAPRKAGSPLVVVAALVIVGGAMLYLGTLKKPDAPKPAIPASTAPEPVAASVEVAQKKSEARVPAKAETKAEVKVESVAGRGDTGASVSTDGAVDREAAKPAAAPGPAPSGERLVVRMQFDQESWVEIKDRNGNVVFGQLNPAGSRRSAGGEPPLSIVIGNAAGVRLFKGEETIDLAPHTRVDVARLTLE